MWLRAFSPLLCTGQAPRSVAFLDGKATRIVVLVYRPTVKMAYPESAQRFLNPRLAAGLRARRHSLEAVSVMSFRAFRSIVRFLPAAVISAVLLAPLHAQPGPAVMEHDGSTVMFEPYAPNIIRVTLSMQHDAAVAAPGYGFVAKPESDGWTHTTDEHGDTYRSSRLVVTLDANHHGGKPSLTQADIGKVFYRFHAGGAHPHCNAAGLDAAGYGGMAAVRAQPQGRQRGHSLRQAADG